MTVTNRRPLALFLAAAAILAGCIDGEKVAKAVGPSSQSLEDDFKEGEGALAGLVVDSEAIPLGGATVVVIPGDIVFETDSTGLFRIASLLAGDYVVSAEKKGYADAEVEVAVVAGQTVDITLILEPIAASVPFHEILTFEGYLMCHFFMNTETPPFYVNAPCGGAIDLITGQDLSEDVFIFPFRIEKPGFSNLLIEMEWEPQQFGTNAVVVVWGSREAAQTSGTTIQYYGDAQASPFRALLTPGVLNHGWQVPDEAPDENATFYPTPNATAEYQYVWAGGGGNTTIPGVAIFVDLRSTSYLTFFYNRPASAQFTALPPPE